jgi:hypothetical protein
MGFCKKFWCPRVTSNEKLWEVTGETNINMEIRKRKFGWTGHTHTTVSLAQDAYKSKGKANMATDYTEWKWEAQLEWS